MAKSGGAGGSSAAAAQAAAVQAAVGVHPDRRLREIDLGEYEGRSWDEFAADRELAAAFAREPLATTLPGGESLAMVRERVIAAFEEIVGGDDAVACLVSHDGPIRTILNHVLEVPPRASLGDRDQSRGAQPARNERGLDERAILERHEPPARPGSGRRRCSGRGAGASPRALDRGPALRLASAILPRA